MKSAFFAALAAVSLCAVTAFAAERYENIHIANGLATASAGDWVLFKLPGGKTQKHTVMTRNGTGKEATATVQMVDFEGNVPVFSRKVTSQAGEEFTQPPMPDGTKYTFERRKETVDFQGTATEVTVVDVFEGSGDKKIRTWYLSTEFPVYGVLKRLDGNGTEEISLVTFGSGANTDPYAFPGAKTAPAPAE